MGELHGRGAGDMAGGEHGSGGAADHLGSGGYGCTDIIVI